MEGTFACLYIYLFILRHFTAVSTGLKKKKNALVKSHQFILSVMRSFFFLQTKPKNMSKITVGEDVLA